MHRLPALTRWTWWNPLGADAALAVGLYVSQVLTWLAAPDLSGLDAADPSTVLIWGAVGMLPVVFRRRWLWPAIFAATALLLLGVLDRSVWAGQGLGIAVLGYTVAAYQGWWRAIGGTVLLWITGTLTFVYGHNAGYLTGADGRESMTLSGGLSVNTVIMVVLFLVGRTVRARRETAAALAERATQAEANQTTHAAQAVAEERRRIARELHDVVAHHVSVIGIMATGARRMLNRDPVATDEALATIEQTSRTTLRELRRLLFVLRAETEPDAQLSPQPGLAGVRTLVDQVREAGLATTLRVDGIPGDLDPGMALTVYRIVQEALTNTIKHAGPATAEVRLRCEPEQLTIEVFDTGRGPRPTSGDGAALGSVAYGHGLLGMRERVAVHGGTLRTGPRPGGGFRVYAKIPISEMETDR